MTGVRPIRRGPSGPRGSAFGLDFQETEATNVFSTTSGVRVTALTLVTEALRGLYRVCMITQFEITTAATRGELALRNVTDGVDLTIFDLQPGVTAIIAPDAWRVVEFTGAPKTFEIQVARLAGAGSVVLSYRAMQNWRVE